MFTLPCKRRKERKERKEAQVPVISAPFMFRREETGEVKSILEMLNTQLPGGLPPKLDLNSLQPRSAAIQESIGDRSLYNIVENNPDVPSAPKNLRAVCSSPELRGNSEMPPLPPLRLTRSRQSDSCTVRRRSWFSVKTEIIEGRRSAVRKVLDTIGCTKGDNFDIRDFQRVKAPAHMEALRTTSRTSTVHPRRPPRVSFTWIGPLQAVPKIVVTSAT